MSGIGIIAALPREVAGLVAGAVPDPALRARGIYLYRLGGTLVAAAGMGSERVTLAVQCVRDSGRVDELISTGLAGACSDAVPVGAVVSVSAVVDARTGERFQTDDAAGAGALVSTSGIASVHEKARLAATYGAVLVDMEAATVARLALAHGLRFRAVKAVSDGHDFELESLSRFTGKHGMFRTRAFALHTAMRPHHWRRTLQLGRNSTRALAALHKHLQTFL